MNFLNPLALIGLAAAGIPLILHLLNLRKLKTVEFSTLRFLKELQKTKIRRLKLKQILLLILRTLIIIFAVMAFARPTIQDSLPILSTYAKTSAAIIIDNSFSMDVSDEYGNRFKQAKNIAESIIKKLNEGDEACILTMTESSEFRNDKLTRNISLLQKELEDLKISNTVANIRKPLIEAGKLLNESMNLNKEIYIISDAQANVFHEEFKDSSSRPEIITNAFFVPVGKESQAGLRNLSMDSLRVISRIFQLEKLVEVEAQIRNNSDKDISGILASMYFNQERVAQRTIDIPAGELKSILISAPASKAGLNKAYIELEEDALDVDNKRYFGFAIPPAPNIALVGPDDKTRYISYALSNSLIAPEKLTIFSPQKFSGIDVSKFEIIICAGGPYKSSDYDRLVQFVSDGGSALMFADSEADMKTFNTGMVRLGLGDIKEITFPEPFPGSFSSVEKLHPLFDGVFKGATNRKEIVESPKIFRAMVNNGGRPIISMQDGYFLSESVLGDGKVIYCAVTPNTEWSTFPITGLFPAMIYRSILYMTTGEDMGHNILAGESLMLQLPKKFATTGNFKIIDPMNAEFYKQALILPSGANLSFGKQEQLGNYAVYTSNDKNVAVVSVNPDPSESLPVSLKKDEIIKALESKLAPGSHIEIIEESKDLQAGIARAKTGSELWQLFIIAAILCAIAEMLVARASKNDFGDK